MVKKCLKNTAMLFHLKKNVFNKKFISISLKVHIMISFFYNIDCPLSFRWLNYQAVSTST